VSLLLSILNGEFLQGLLFLFNNSSIHIWIVFLSFCTFGFVGANFSTAITAHYGALINGLSNTFRKAVTIVVSFVMFPERNELTSRKIYGALVFFIGLLVSIFTDSKTPKHSKGHHHPHSHHKTKVNSPRNDTFQRLEEGESRSLFVTEDDADEEEARKQRLDEVIGITGVDDILNDIQGHEERLIEEEFYSISPNRLSSNSRSRSRSRSKDRIGLIEDPKEGIMKNIEKEYPSRQIIPLSPPFPMSHTRIKEKDDEESIYPTPLHSRFSLTGTPGFQRAPTSVEGIKSTSSELLPRINSKEEERSLDSPALIAPSNSLASVQNRINRQYQPPPPPPGNMIDMISNNLTSFLNNLTTSRKGSVDELDKQGGILSPVEEVYYHGRKGNQLYRYDELSDDDRSGNNSNKVYSKHHFTV
jgi:hypothetical protein